MRARSDTTRTMLESAFYSPAPGRAFTRCTRVLDEGQRMRRFVITGAPGDGKTAIIRQLELDGFSVVEEAATDVVIHPCQSHRSAHLHCEYP